MNTCFAPDVHPSHLAPLDGRGPSSFARFDEAAVRGPNASLRSGKLVGYTGWCHWLFPEKLACIDGQFYAKPSAADGRATSGCHDPLPWLAACCDRVGAGDLGLGAREEIPPQFDKTYSLQPTASGLSEALCDATRAVLRTHMPARPGAIEFAHHNPTPGWVFRADRGAVGHFAHIDNALYLYLWTGDLQARETWFNWLAQMKAAGKQFTACDRETHTHFVRCHLAAVHANDATYDVEATRLARLLISKPAAEHKETLYHPLWPYYAWQRLGKEAEPWIVAAADWLGPTSGNSDLVVAAIAYWITGKREYLTRKLADVVAWADGYFREPGGPLDWLGQCTGRTGDGYAPNNWPIFKRACLDAGLTDADVPAFVAENSYPLGGKLAIITGADISRGMVRYLSYQGDTNGGRLRALDAADRRLAELIFEGPWKSNRAAAPFDFASSLQPPASSLTLPVTRIQALAYQQMLGPLTDDPTEAVEIEPRKPYELGRCRGTLETPGAVTIEAMNEHVTFYNEQGEPALGLFSGYHPAMTACSLQSPASSLYHIDARGPQYLRWRFTCTAGGRWKALR